MALADVGPASTLSGDCGEATEDRFCIFGIFERDEALIFCSHTALLSGAGLFEAVDELMGEVVRGGPLTELTLEEVLLEMAAETNKIGLPRVEREFGVRLPSEKYLFTGSGFAIPEDWDEEVSLGDGPAENQDTGKKNQSITNKTAACACRSPVQAPGIAFTFFGLKD